MKKNKSFEEIMILLDIQEEINKKAIRIPSKASWEKIFGKIFREKK